MSERIRWEIHDGVEILVSDFSKITSPDDARAAAKESEEAICARPLGSVRRVSCVSDSFFTDELKKITEEYSKNIRPYTKAAAAVGFTGLKGIILKAINRSIKFCDTLDEAIDWLKKQ
ncbi:MAG: hypothetical protein HZC28_00220 [Spirochaetes bacterium]|nr:hypothetical protein [Spirochaetota bacterium]